MKTALILFNRDLRLHDNPALAAAARAERTLPLFVFDERAARLALRRPQPGRLHARGAGRPRRGAAPGRRAAVPAARRPGRGGDRRRPRVRRRRVPCQRRPQRLRTGTGAAAGGGLRGGADRVPRPSRGDDRAAGRGDPGRRRPLQGLHALPPRLERGAAARRGPGAARARTCPAGFAPAACRRWKADRRLALAAAGHGRREGRPATDAGLPARRPRRIRRAPRRPRRRRDLAAQRPTSTSAASRRWRCAAGARARRRGVRPPALLARLPPPGPRRRPSLPRRDYRPRGDRWSRSRRALEAWQEGRPATRWSTPAMRQLRREGWMHNRARMVVASFLVKDLGIDWRAGRRHFLDLLVDGDVAQEHRQLAVGRRAPAPTPVPTASSTRLRRPKRFDPEGAYVRRYVPELESVEGKAIVHGPGGWTASPSSTTRRRSSTTTRPRRATGRPIARHRIGRWDGSR